MINVKNMIYELLAESTILRSRRGISVWLKSYDIKTYKINEDLSVDVDGDVSLSYRFLKLIPIKFGTIRGDFNCGGNSLSSLVGCPSVVGGDFKCSNNELTSLEGCPVEIGGAFYCSNNKLTSLEYCPVSVGGLFDCSGNKLVGLKYCPKEIVSDFDCDNNRLVSLEGGPFMVGGNFRCSYNQLTSMEYCPFSVGWGFSCIGNKLVESECFLYSSSAEQINQYYKNKNLNKKMQIDLVEKVVIKNKKI